MIDYQAFINAVRREIRALVDPLLLQERAKILTSPGGGTLRVELVPTQYIRTIAQEEFNAVNTFYTEQPLAQGVCVVTTGNTVTYNGETLPVVVPVDVNNANHSKNIVGVVLQTTAENNPVRVLKKGLFTYQDGTTLTAGNVVFIAANGKLSTTPPTNALFLACMGHAVTTTTVFVEYRYVVGL